MKRIFVLSGTLFIFLGMLASVQAEIDNTRQKELLHLLRHDCGSCHGMRMKGGLGPALLPDDLADKPSETLEATILYGRAGTPMPPWNSLLTTEEAGWLISILKKGVPADVR